MAMSQLFVVVVVYLAAAVVVVYLAAVVVVVDLVVAVVGRQSTYTSVCEEGV